MSFEWLMLILCAVGWVGALRLFLLRRSLPRIFGLLIMSIWLYVSVMLVLFTFAFAIEWMLCFAALPIFVVAYGYRVYEHRQNLKNSVASEEAGKEASS